MNKYKNIILVFIGVIMGVALVFAGLKFIPSNIIRSNHEQTQVSNTHQQPKIEQQIIKRTTEESDIINVVKKVNDAVVSIIISKDLPIIERYMLSPFDGPLSQRFGIPYYRQRGYKKEEVGGGTGFIVSSDGYLLTNRHVVLDDQAEYTVLMNNEKKYSAKVLAKDFYNDIAVLKIDAQDLPTIELGSSENIDVGQTVIAIGNALGEFRNTVSLGIVSGLSRSIVAGGQGMRSEQLTGLIQTDASINPGNSGGPLLDLSGRVIGINTAVVYNAQSIGFATPIDLAKSVFDSVQKHGRIIRPWLGIQYVAINEEFAKQNKIPYNYGALLWVESSGYDNRSHAIIPNSPAAKAGLKDGDIILEVDDVKIDKNNSLVQLIGRYQPGDKVNLKIFRNNQENSVDVVLEEMKSQYVEDK